MRKIFFLSLLAIIVAGCGLGDYTKNLGNGYTLEKTNSCCVFIFKKNVAPKQNSNVIVFDNRVIKPLVKELFFDNEKIVGLKVENECCFLSGDEKKNNTKNGYFIIYKKKDFITDGLTKQELRDMNVSIDKMEKVL